MKSNHEEWLCKKLKIIMFDLEYGTMTGSTEEYKSNT